MAMKRDSETDEAEKCLGSLGADDSSQKLMLNAMATVDHATRETILRDLRFAVQSRDQHSVHGQIFCLAIGLSLAGLFVLFGLLLWRINPHYSSIFSRGLALVGLYLLWVRLMRFLSNIEEKDRVRD